MDPYAQYALHCLLEKTAGREQVYGTFLDRLLGRAAKNVLSSGSREMEDLAIKRSLLQNELKNMMGVEELGTISPEQWNEVRQQAERSIFRRGTRKARKTLGVRGELEEFPQIEADTAAKIRGEYEAARAQQGRTRIRTLGTLAVGAPTAVLAGPSIYNAVAGPPTYGFYDYA